MQGIAMGSLLSPIVTELVLDKLFNEIKNNFDIVFLVKCVDDSLCSMNNDILNILIFMNHFDLFYGYL